MDQADLPSHPVLFFDGVCNLCDTFVSFAVRADTLRTFRYAPLQGPTAGELVPGHARSLSSVVLREPDGRVVTGADAVLLFLARLPARRCRILARVARLFPRPLREAIYSAIARNRHVLFGRKPSCRLPSPSERALFLP